MDSDYDLTKELCEKIIDRSKFLKDRIKYLELLSVCPFFFTFDNHIDCPYLNNDNTCKNIEVAPGNRGAWCYKMVERGIKDSSKPWKREV